MELAHSRVKWRAGFSISVVGASGFANEAFADERKREISWVKLPQD